MRVQKTVFISNSASSRLASATHCQEMSNTKSNVSMPLLSCFSTSASGSNKFEKSTSNKGKPKCGFDSIDDALILFDQLLHSCPRPPMIFGEMLKLCVEPNVVTFKTLMNGLRVEGRTGDTVRLLRKIEESAVRPDIVTYNTVIDSLCKDRLIRVAQNIFSEMVGKGILPIFISYSSLVQGMSNLGKWEEVKGPWAGYELFKDMIVHGQAPDSVAYSILLDGFCKHGYIKEALKLFQALKDSGLQPNIISYNVLIDCMCEAGQLEVARELYSGLSMKGKWRMIRCQMIAVIIQGFNKDCLKIMILSRTRQILCEMHDNGFSADATTTTMLVDLLCRNGIDLLSSDKAEANKEIAGGDVK
ncbi:hypothetical protein SLEP1_g17377 [Rubroshorea leprosula]|uniref:Pentatricopeptide repeat-containing protein n=1 Tax=Rubroshorea leprosula TaxID=152421 RepID=A0AAV5J4L3_9ROSI|nr:hypothetical protein SLEP1_g17377 [Rubroshorea leprosula]